MDVNIFSRKVRPKMVATEDEKGDDLPPPTKRKWWEVIPWSLLGVRYFWSTFQGKMRPFTSGEVETNS